MSLELKHPSHLYAAKGKNKRNTLPVIISKAGKYTKDLILM